MTLQFTTSSTIYGFTLAPTQTKSMISYHCNPTQYIITMTSQWPRWRLKWPALRLFTQPFIQAHIKGNIKAPRHWSLWGESSVTGEFPAQGVSNAEHVSLWWRHHVLEPFYWSNLVFTRPRFLSMAEQKQPINQDVTDVASFIGSGLARLNIENVF